MKDVLDEGLIITLVFLQPKKEKVMADYIPSSPQMAPAHCGGGGNCKGTCKTSCAPNCTGNCKNTCKTSTGRR
jgi:hypothetical protein